MRVVNILGWGLLGLDVLFGELFHSQVTVFFDAFVASFGIMFLGIAIGIAYLVRAHRWYVLQKKSMTR
jgi:hypothetical protein